MNIISDNINFRIDVPSVVTIGKFDGIHKGHAQVFKRMEEYRKQGLKIVVFTFDMPVSRVLGGGDGKVLTTREEKRYIFGKLGADYLVEFPFNEKTASISAEEFIDDYLVESMNMHAIVMGNDCRFGHRGMGNAEMLARYAHNYGYEVEVLDKIRQNGVEISSTAIRSCVETGRIGSANEMLLYPYFFLGEVIKGRQLGRTMGMPTVNLRPLAGKLLPPSGVYFSSVEIGGVKYNAITDIGCKPTVEDEKDPPIGVETYIYDFDKQIYGEEISVSLYEFHRSEMKFDSLEALEKQLEKDVALGEKWHKNHV